MQSKWQLILQQEYRRTTMQQGGKVMMREYHNARYPFLYCATTEDERFIRYHRARVSEDAQFFRWDIAEGFRVLTHPDDSKEMWMWESIAIRGVEEATSPMDSNVQVMIPSTAEDDPITDPQTAVKACQFLPAESIIFKYDMHKFFPDEYQGITVIRQILNIEETLMGNGQMLVFLSATVNIPAELQKSVTVIDFDLPDKKTLNGILEKVCEDNAENNISYPENPELFIDAMQGLDQKAAENALSLTLLQHGKFDVKSILSQKAAKLKSTNYITYTDYNETLDDLFGLEELKNFTIKILKSNKARGILIDGVQGCGKSHYSKALANELGRPCLVANFSALRGSLQGQAEERIRDLLQTVEAFGNPIVFCDEFDKTLAGLSGGASTDGGVGNRIMQAWMTYMIDKKPGSFWICTSNNLETIKNWSGGALLRRFNAKFFIDMPTQEECHGIAKIWSKKHKVSIPDDYDFEGFTGADIEQLASTMDMLECDVDEARRYIIPTSKALGPQLNEIRKQAQSICIWASKKQETTSIRRKVKMAA